MIPALMPTYGERTIAFERGEGVYLFDTEGRRYLDFGGGIAVVSLGHAHPHLVKALQEQAAKLWHCSNLYRIPGQEKAGERLVANTFADTVFFCNSGAEAIECGIKMVRKHYDHVGQPERYRVITIEGAFHGRTLATLSAGKQEKVIKGFEPLVEGFDQVPFGNLNALKGAITAETGAILLEPVQGESGIKPMDLDYLRAVRQVCDEFGLLMFLDEIQCGVGRTGRLFAHEWAGVAPDIMAIAKGIGGGFPVGACLATERAADGMLAGSHGSTFGGNPLASAAVNAVLDLILEQGFLPKVEASGKALRDKLETLVARHPKVLHSVRGAGLMLGVRCVATNGDVVAALQRNGLLTVPAGDNVVRLLPPLVIENQHIEEAVGIIDRTCTELAGAA
ncbi:MAG: aspartate aminotransferase family protein [Alphaproteobacteria bacterium]